MQDFKKITVKEGQGLFDIAIQEYGNMAAVFLIIEDNVMVEKVDSNVYAGQLLLIRKDDPMKDVATADALSQSGVSVSSITDDDDISQGSYSKGYSNAYQI